MPGYKLYYFDSRGRAEYIRYLLALAGVEYDDYRISSEEWPELKEKMPFGQVPALEIEGEDTMLVQSYAILRYLGKKLGYYGNTPEEAFLIDMLVDCQEDFNLPLIKFAREKNPEQKAEYKKDFEERVQPVLLQKFENILKRNNGGDGWFVGDQISVADLAVYHGTSWPMDVFGMYTPWEDFPKLRVLKDKVVNHPNIRAWIESRPKTPW